LNKIEDSGLKASTLPGKCQEVLMAAIEMTIDHLLGIGPPESVLP
jgi:hypothetical protein